MRLSAGHIIFLILIFWSVSCAQQYVPGVVNYDDESFDSYVVDCQGDNHSIAVKYLGFSNLYFIFEMQFTNEAPDTQLITRTDFAMDVLDGRVEKPFDKYSLVDLLYQNHDELKKVRKRRTTWAAILTGLELVATLGQSNVASTILYGTESTIYILEERNFIQREMNTLDEEINYVYDLALDTIYIPPGESIYADLLFPIQPIDSDVDIMYTHDRQETRCRFDRSLF